MFDGTHFAIIDHANAMRMFEKALLFSTLSYFAHTNVPLATHTNDAAIPKYFNEKKKEKKSFVVESLNVTMHSMSR